MQQNGFERFPKATLFLLYCACLIILFAVDLAITKAWQYCGSFQEFKKVRVASPLYHHDLRPMVKDSSVGTNYFSFYRITTNSLGFRDREARHIALVNPHQKRLVFIGDSFTEGVNVKYENTFVGRISSSESFRNVEVLNAAVGSYSPSIYYRKVKYLLEETELKFDQLVVFLDLSDIHDECALEIDPFGNVISMKTKCSFGSRLPPLNERFSIFLSGFFRPTTLFRLARDRIELLTGPQFGLGEEKALWTSDAVLFEAYGKKGIAKARHRMDQLAALLKKHHIDLTLAVYPWEDQIILRELNSMQVSIWSEWAAAHHVTFINLFPKFINGEDPYAVIKKYFIRGDIHWNESGHKLIADWFERNSSVF